MQKRRERQADEDERAHQGERCAFTLEKPVAVGSGEPVDDPSEKRKEKDLADSDQHRQERQRREPEPRSP